MVRFPNALPFYYKRVAQAQQVIVDGLQHMTHLALVPRESSISSREFWWLVQAAHGPRHTQGHAHTRVGIKALPPASFCQKWHHTFWRSTKKNAQKKMKYQNCGPSHYLRAFKVTKEKHLQVCLDSAYCSPQHFHLFPKQSKNPPLTKKHPTFPRFKFLSRPGL